MDKLNINELGLSKVLKKDQIKSIIESLLFAAGDPLHVKDIGNIISCGEEEIRELVKEMEEEYNKTERGIKIISIDNGYQLVTKSYNSDYIQMLLRKNVRQSLSQASLESLAIIAYRQPITRVDIDDIRGVKSDSAIQRLMERSLIKEMGRLEVPGRPILYGTTEEFLRAFGLETLQALPSLDIFNSGEEDEEPEFEE